MKIYLASPFFCEEELSNVERVEKILLDRGFDVFSPRLHEVRTDRTINTAFWSKQTFESDRRAIDDSDAIVMLYYGSVSDSGTAWECGYAYAKGKPTVVVHFGTCSNLMVHEGCRANISLDELYSYDFEKMPPKAYSGEMI